MSNDVTTIDEKPSDASSNQNVSRWFKKNNHGNRLLTLVLFLPPALLLFTIFVILPIGEAGYYSLFRWNGYGEPTQWVDFSNYARLFNHSAFDTAIWNTLKIILISIVVQLPLALIVALYIYKRLDHVSSVFFLPYILAEVAAGLIWRFVLMVIR